VDRHYAHRLVEERPSENLAFAKGLCDVHPDSSFAHFMLRELNPFCISGSHSGRHRCNTRLPFTQWLTVLCVIPDLWTNSFRM